jgi:N-acetylglucosaminyl-diphospho-decaprenol L-rhamnosyltransferase
VSPSLDIIIVNWNAGSQLRECLSSLKGEIEGVNVGRIVVVDNASQDDSLESIKDVPLPLTLILNSDNRGFGAACNQGAKDSQADQLLFLNPDTRLFPGALGKAVACLETGERRRIGIVGAQLVNEQGRPHFSCARFPSFFPLLNEMLGLAQLCPNVFRGLFMRDWDHTQSREVDHVMGAFALMRRSLFESLHGFDERFFMYLEDLDLSFRARQMGWRSFFLAEAQVYHTGGGTSRQVKARRLSDLLRSRIRYAHKHMGLSRTGLTIGIIFTAEFVLRIAKAVVRLDWGRIEETVEGYLLLCKDILKERWRQRAVGAEEDDE